MYNENDIVKVNFNGNEYDLRVDSTKGINVDISECLKAIDSDELYEYLYQYQKHMFDEINGDPFFEGKTIKSGNDLKNAIEELKVIACKRDVVYICGEYWCDPEHGFSIKFPNGKFVKSEFETYEYNRDEGAAANYTPKCTVLGLYSDYL